MIYDLDEHDVARFELSERALQALVATAFAAAKALGYTGASFKVVRGDEHWERAYSPHSTGPSAK